MEIHWEDFEGFINDIWPALVGSGATGVAYRKIKKKPKLDWYLIVGGHLLHYKKDAPEAINVLDDGKNYYPNSSMLYYLLGAAYLSCNPPELNACKKVIKRIDNKLSETGPVLEKMGELNITFKVSDIKSELKGEC